MRALTSLWNLRSGPFRETIAGMMDDSVRDTLFNVCKCLRHEYPWVPLSGAQAWSGACAPLKDPRWTATPWAWRLLAMLRPEAACATAAYTRNMACMRWVRGQDPPCPWDHPSINTCIHARCDPSSWTELREWVDGVYADMRCVPELNFWQTAQELLEQPDRVGDAFFEMADLEQEGHYEPVQRLYLNYEEKGQTLNKVFLLIVHYGTPDDLVVMADVLRIRRSVVNNGNLAAWSDGYKMMYTITERYFDRLFPVAN